MIMHVYSYGTPIRVWDIILAHTRTGYPMHTRMGRPIRIWANIYTHNIMGQNNTVLKYSVTKTRPQSCIVLTCYVEQQNYLLVFIIANLLYISNNFKVFFGPFLPSVLGGIDSLRAGRGGMGGGHIRDTP